jgi:mono/diheme cytochrome c family protein
VGVLVGLLVLASVASAQTVDPKKAAAGKKLFVATNCTMCHGAEGKGNQKLSLDGVNKKLTPVQIRQWITSPVEMTAKLPAKPLVPMKKFELKDADVDALVAYVTSLK